LAGEELCELSLRDPAAADDDLGESIARPDALLVCVLNLFHRRNAFLHEQRPERKTADGGTSLDHGFLPLRDVHVSVPHPSNP
jgi:hypothetical protein